MSAQRSEEDEIKRHAASSGPGIMSLSAEVRNYIYELVLRVSSDGKGMVRGTSAIDVTLAVPRQEDEMEEEGFEVDEEEQDSEERLNATTLARQPALTRVSRVIRAETLPMFYGQNHFVIYTTCEMLQLEGVPTAPGPQPVRLTLGRAERWLDRIGFTNRALIRNLELCHSVPTDGEECWDFFQDAVDLDIKDQYNCLASAKHLIMITHSPQLYSWYPVDPSGSCPDVFVSRSYQDSDAPSEGSITEGSVAHRRLTLDCEDS